MKDNPSPILAIDINEMTVNDDSRATTIRYRLAIYRKSKDAGLTCREVSVLQCKYISALLKRYPNVGLTFNGANYCSPPDRRFIANRYSDPERKYWEKEYWCQWEIRKHLPGYSLRKYF